MFHYQKTTALLLAVMAVSVMGANTISASASCDMCYVCTSESNARVRSNPEMANNQIDWIQEGEVVRVLSQSNGWCQIAYEDSKGNTKTGYSSLDLYKQLILSEDVIFMDEDKQTVYQFLQEELQLNRSAIFAIMVNIDCESRWNPLAKTIDTNDLPSFGLFQWNGVRFENLKSFCQERQLDYQSIQAQMQFLKYELTHDYQYVYNRMKKAELSANGCYEASKYWASKFEVCAEEHWEERGEQAYYCYLAN